jgi:hypothetical protein
VLSFDRITSNVEVMQTVLIVANSVISESALPDFAGSANHAAERMRVSAFDQLNGMFERDVVGGCEN